MADIIMVQMVKELIKKIDIKSFVTSNKVKKNLVIAMLALIAIIAIILIDLMNKDRIRLIELGKNVAYNESSVDIAICNDDLIVSFIHNYFKAKNSLNYQKIFEAYGRDYYAEERNDIDGSFARIMNVIKYEKIFIESYDDIVVYTCRGYREDETVCVVTYDMKLGFTDTKAPMIMIFYLMKGDEGYIIKDKMDVGTSKYLEEISNLESVKALYDNVAMRLDRASASSEGFRLVYNTLRQFEINQNVDIGNLAKMGGLDVLDIWKLDPIKDADKIYNLIIGSNNQKKNGKKLDEYLDRVVASLSDVQKNQ